MDFVSLAAGAITAVLSLLAILLALWTKFERRQERLMYRVLVDAGLSRYRRPSDQDRTIEWPNGWNNLPDAIGGIDKRLKKLEGKEKP